MSIPNFKVQLVHIDGPLKGEIQEFFETVISIGRHPDCQVVFPKSNTAISRKHAEIKREGNRFKFIDHSTNGTLINGKSQKDVFLKNGDVLIVGGNGGPKVSFLSTQLTPEEEATFASTKEGTETQSTEVPPPTDSPRKLKNVIERQAPEAKPKSSKPNLEKLAKQPKQPDLAHKPTSNANTIAQPDHSTVKTFIIQHGPTINSFNNLPITIGTGADCDCILQHPALLERHAQVFFQDKQYWIKDLTGRSLVNVSGMAVQSESPLLPNCNLTLTPKGPEFTFLGEGRLAEIHAQDKCQSDPLGMMEDKQGQQHKTTTRADPRVNSNIFRWILVIVLGLCLATAAWYFISPSFMP